MTEDDSSLAFDIGSRFLGTERSEPFLTYGHVFQAAVNKLLDNSKSIDNFTLKSHSYGILPVLSMFYMCVEVKLKGIILMVDSSVEVGKMGHSLSACLDKLKNFDKIKVSAETEKSIRELEILGNKSQSFRYPERKSGEYFYKDGTYLSMKEFSQMIRDVMRELENIEGNLNNERENREDNQ